MGSPKRRWKHSLKNLLGAGKEKKRKDFKSSSSVATNKRHWKQTESGGSSGRKSWRSTSLRAYDVDLGLQSSSPFTDCPEWKSQSFRNVSSSAWTVDQGGMRRSTSANSFSRSCCKEDSSYLALEKLFDQFQGRHLDTKKVLVTVNVLGTIGRLRLFVEDTITVRQLIAMTLNEYAFEHRLPPLENNIEAYVLYLTPVDSLSLAPQDTVRQLGHRSFYLGQAKEVILASFRKAPTQETSKDSRSWFRAILGISHISNALRFHDEKLASTRAKSML